MHISPVVYLLIGAGVMLFAWALGKWSVSTPEFKRKPEAEQAQIRRTLKWSIATVPLWLLGGYVLREYAA